MEYLNMKPENALTLATFDTALKDYIQSCKIIYNSKFTLESLERELEGSPIFSSSYYELDVTSEIMGLISRIKRASNPKDHKELINNSIEILEKYKSQVKKLNKEIKSIYGAKRDEIINRKRDVIKRVTNAERYIQEIEDWIVSDSFEKLYDISPKDTLRNFKEIKSRIFQGLQVGRDNLKNEITEG